MKKLFFLLSCFLIGIVESQIIIEDPVIDVGNFWSYHYIESFHFTTHGGFVFLNDGSSWEINPFEAQEIQESCELLINVPLTIMPDAGVELHPMRIIVHGEHEMGWTDFTAQYLSAPTDDEASTIAKVDHEQGRFLIINIPINGKTTELSLLINPHDSATLKKWKKGQKVTVGGIWLPEYDFNEHKDYSSAYQYVLFNYALGNYVFFTVDSTLPSN